LAIARRGLGLSERPTVQVAVVPTRRGGHVTFALPVGNRAKHVWSFWAEVQTHLKAALQAQVLSRKPAQEVRRTTGSVGGEPHTSDSGNAIRECLPNLAGEIPARESFPKPFGERHGRCSILTMEYLSMVRGTA
jgi:hypothetical protein